MQVASKTMIAPKVRQVLCLYFGRSTPVECRLTFPSETERASGLGRAGTILTVLHDTSSVNPLAKDFIRVTKAYGIPGSGGLCPNDEQSIGQDRRIPKMRCI